MKGMIYTGGKPDKKIVIREDADNDMLKITIGNECVFHGNEWDFKRDANSLRDFLDKLGVKAEVEKGVIET